MFVVIANRVGTTILNTKLDIYMDGKEGILIRAAKVGIISF